DHRRAPADARLRPLCRAAYTRGRASQRFDTWRGEAPSLTYELRTLAGCLGHVFRRRCVAGLVMVAHSSGRLLEALRKNGPRRMRGASIFADSTPSHELNQADGARSSDDFLSGESGTVGGLDGLRRAALDLGA